MKLIYYLSLLQSFSCYKKLSNEQRIVAIGDLHGDYDQAIRVLKVAKVINEEKKWIGGSETIFVQTGDVVDRGKDTKDLYRLMKRLRREADSAGGQVISLLGNHEIMNMMEDYRYVTHEDIATFKGVINRKKVFSAEGWIGKYLRGLNLTAIVGDTVFAHGGIHPSWAKVGVKSINEQTVKFLTELKPDDLWSVDLFGSNGPAWYRGYALEVEKSICSQLDSALKAMKVNRMVLGHTVQETGKITARCNGRVLLIDVGISRAYYANLAALELTNEYARGLYPDGEVEDLPIPEALVAYEEEEEDEGYDSGDKETEDEEL
jgi:hypothetical protein